MRVLVCGGRNFAAVDVVHDVLDRIHCSRRIDVIIQGGALGADLLSRHWAETHPSHNISILEFKPDWRTHGKSAGPMRNQRMIDQGTPDLVVAFPGRHGTADMIQRSERAGIPVRRFDDDGIEVG